jgi:calcium binding protein 39
LRRLPLCAQLLGELLLTPGNVEVMMRYINDVSHLILIMTLLRDASRSIQFEAFHIFKVFVANPSKPAAVVDILRKNADRLLRFLSDFQTDREDEEFANEKAVLCRVLRELL